ncbi:nitroreductase [Nitzschia inconspicua]|uniref:Nitroreductase n=1 Tax=Nitzschia inconspicua TaxID=303405 RepID=A0A9K3PVG4_9STRA|nr:nitroreductase [Nitzschia inconspicua]
MATKASIFRTIAHSRKTCRRFQPGRIIPQTTLQDILQSTIRSPSSFNLQPSQIILVQSQTVKDDLSEHAMLGIGNQYRTRQASAVAVFLSDLEPSKRINKVYQLEKEHRHPNYRATMPLATSFLIGEGHAATLIKGIATQFLSAVQPMPDVEPVLSWSYKNTSLLAQSFVYAAESHDLATAMMEGFDPRRVKEILRIPDRYAVPLVVATGYEYEEESETEPTPRLNISEVVFEDTFGREWKHSNDESASS